MGEGGGPTGSTLPGLSAPSPAPLPGPAEAAEAGDVWGGLLEVARTNESVEEVAESLGLHVLSVYELGMWFFLYGLIAFLAVAGNLLVMYVILSRPRMQTVTNYFIINLAVGDALTGLLAIPFKFQAALLQQWLIPSFMCQLVPFIETVSLSVSVFTLSGTAIDRFRAVVFPLRPKMTKSAARLIIFFIWIVSLACSTPYGLYHKVKTIEPMPNMSLRACMPEFGDHLWWKVYNVYLTIIQYFVPLFIINGAYCVIGYKVYSTSTHGVGGSGGGGGMGNGPLADPRAKAFEQSKRRVIKMLVIVVMVFTFCWLPYETYLVLNEIRPEINNFRFINVLFFCCHWLAMSNSCLNPIIYGIYNEKFQREYKRVLGRVCGVGREHESLTEVNLDSLGNAQDAPPDNNPNSCHFYIASELGKDDD